MLRQALQQQVSNHEFRYRGGEPGRLENLSDSAFGMAITLILISTSPPTDFQQVKSFAWNVIPFILCIIVIMLTWYEHFIFFYRYGLRDTKVILLNTLFLVIVLFFVYPLKFLTQMILVPVGFLFQNQELVNAYYHAIRFEDWGDLMIIYGLGAASLYFTLMMMYRHALSKADELELNAIEIFDTRIRLRTNFLMGIVPLVSVVLAFVYRGKWQAAPIAGFVYFLYYPIMFLHGRQASRKRQGLIDQQQE